MRHKSCVIKKMVCVCVCGNNYKGKVEYFAIKTIGIIGIFVLVKGGFKIFGTKHFLIETVFFRF